MSFILAKYRKRVMPTIGRDVGHDHSCIGDEKMDIREVHQQIVLG